ncbi:DEAD/DEAH box helicase, partial [Flavobacteriales bacterium]|nr:DEAD/DEAH box helicase [Flavobacteriales bacterium]
MSFSTLGLSSELLSALEEQKYQTPYPIQQIAIPDILQGHDILGIAPTGSGKTAAYVLPILNQLQNLKKTKNRHVQTLVLVPSRELAIQVNEVVQSFASSLTERIKSLAVFGGVSINPQMIALQHVSILVATPGRLLDLVNSNAVSLSGVDTLVLDEADKMLNLGFKQEMERIFKLLPNKRQNLLFSATFSEDVDAVHQQVLNEPKIIRIKALKKNIDQIIQTAYRVSEERKGPLLRYIIKSKELTQVLVFTSSTHKADRVVEKLRQNGIEAGAIHSKKSQSVRTKTLERFKDGALRVVVATDLLGRGIDIDLLPYIINYELPRSPKD